MGTVRDVCFTVLSRGFAARFWFMHCAKAQRNAKGGKETNRGGAISGLSGAGGFRVQTDFAVGVEVGQIVVGQHPHPLDSCAGCVFSQLVHWALGRIAMVMWTIQEQRNCVR